LNQKVTYKSEIKILLSEIAAVFNIFDILCNFFGTSAKFSVSEHLDTGNTLIMPDSFAFGFVFV